MDESIEKSNYKIYQEIADKYHFISEPSEEESNRIFFQILHPIIETYETITKSLSQEIEKDYITMEKIVSAIKAKCFSEDYITNKIYEVECMFNDKVKLYKSEYIEYLTYKKIATQETFTNFFHACKIKDEPSASANESAEEFLRSNYLEFKKEVTADYSEIEADEDHSVIGVLNKYYALKEQMLEIFNDNDVKPDRLQLLMPREVNDSVIMEMFQELNTASEFTLSSAYES